jgi:hypothetical protein
MDFLIWLVVFWFGFIIASTLLKYWLNKKVMEYDPFGFNQYMTTTIKCEKCGWSKSRYWAKGDFVGKEIDVRAVYPKSKLGKHKKCDDKVFVIGIYWQRKMSKTEEKYNELCRKWGNPEGNYV